MKRPEGDPTVIIYLGCDVTLQFDLTDVKPFAELLLQLAAEAELELAHGPG